MRKILFILIIVIFSLENTYAAGYTYRLESVSYSPAQGCTTANRYSYTLSTSASTFRTGTFGYGAANINGRMSALSVAIDYSLKPNNSYSISFWNPNSGFVKPEISNVSIAFLNGTIPNSCGSVVTRKTPTSIQVSDSRLIINFTTPSTQYDAFGIEVNDDLGSYYLTGNATNFRLNPNVELTDLTAEGTADSYQQIIDSQNQNTDKIIDNDNKNHEELMGELTDTTPPDTSVLIDAPGWLPPGPVDSIATLPINLLQSLTNNLGSACTPISINLPFVDTYLSLPCPGTILRQIDGFWIFWESFGLIAGVWCLYKYFINLYKWVESHLSMDEKESLGKWGGV